MPDVVGITGWLAGLITERTDDTAIVLDEPGKLAIIVPLDAAVYLVTVQEAQFVPASNTGTEGDK